MAHPDYVPATLPVYRLEKPRVTSGSAKALFDFVFGGAGDGVSVEDRETYIRASVGTTTLDVDKRSGYVFVADRAKLWNPRENPRLPNAARAWELSRRLVQAGGPLTPAVAGRAASIRTLSVAFEDLQNTSTMHASHDSPRESFALDQQVIRQVVVKLAQSSGPPLRVPVTGGGGKFRVAYGDRGSLIGLSGGWRPIVEQIGEKAVVPPQRAIDDFKAQFPNHIVKNARARLAYYAAPPFVRQETLAPVWIVDGNLWSIDGEVDEVRTQLLPATSTDPFIEPEPSPAAPLLRAPAANLTLDCGVAWMGAAGSSFEENKNRFVAECVRQGASVKTNLGNDDVLEQHFHTHDGQFADAVDLMFFTGHANADGWKVSTPDRTRASYDPGEGPPVRFGDGKLDWLVIAACGPLQSIHFDQFHNDALERWGGTFAGLHGMLGFGGISYSCPQEGERFMELIGDGETVIDAWFRTAVEVQPCIEQRRNGHSITVVAMFAHDGNYCTKDERLTVPTLCPGIGTPEQQLTLIWSET
jgi:hypothetical protein